MKAPSCCRALEDSETCEHKQLYIEAEAYIRRQGIQVGYAPSGASESAWRGGRCHVNAKAIDIWPTAFTLYGWGVVTSVLIHEFGHCQLYEAEHIYDGSIETERKASEYGARFMLRNLIPQRYEEHRAFFLQSYEHPEDFDTKDKWLQALERWPG